MLRFGSTTAFLLLLGLALASHGGAAEGDTSSPEEFGTNDFGWTTILGNQHNPSDSEFSSYAGDLGAIYRVSGVSAYDAQLQLPSGALLHQVVWFGRDDAPAAHLRGAVISVCQLGIPPGPPDPSLLGDADFTSASGDFSLAIVLSPAVVIDNLRCAYFARTFFDSGETDTLILRKIRAGWQRQVSAAPVTATFPNDTPTTHPFFQFIEALAASGITAGCAPQSFCPDDPITRGQMAVFLSVALGLHFPN